jgi:hypothetical protein
VISAQEKLNAPFNAQSILQHFDAAHEVGLDIVERATLALQQSNSGTRIEIFPRVVRSDRKCC